jgi:hypothetical protein
MEVLLDSKPTSKNREKTKVSLYRLYKLNTKKSLSSLKEAEISDMDQKFILNLLTAVFRKELASAELLNISLKELQSLFRIKLDS